MHAVFRSLPAESSKSNEPTAAPAGGAGEGPSSGGSPVPGPVLDATKEAAAAVQARLKEALKEGPNRTKEFHQRIDELTSRLDQMYMEENRRKTREKERPNRRLGAGAEKDRGGAPSEKETVGAASSVATSRHTGGGWRRWRTKNFEKQGEETPKDKKRGLFGGRRNFSSANNAVVSHTARGGQQGGGVSRVSSEASVQVHDAQGGGRDGRGGLCTEREGRIVRIACSQAEGEVRDPANPPGVVSHSHPQNVTRSLEYSNANAGGGGGTRIPVKSNSSVLPSNAPAQPVPRLKALQYSALMESIQNVREEPELSLQQRTTPRDSEPAVPVSSASSLNASLHPPLSASGAGEGLKEGTEASPVSLFEVARQRKSANLADEAADGLEQPAGEGGEGKNALSCRNPAKGVKLPTLQLSACSRTD
uniref:Uncharacterized protein n=1 Tax=Chromera velia CCMP2878 TaxID=1169474 RepID=A0A0G4GAD3_9ALVE|eukprot:Cvel_4427.t1-p1 / transcript=Cvel_4427.t1 / gene=Cvel_4427 / organism=Chromera_velia_CCMP2878 / gene_product=hypothetical protein / transcript_product=hypothetical protein / location=Cvel_scaffold192:114672-117255(-) / protein_length=420 / sequence_SO=supercontig / SO=protein_coding / is_pseudo=false